MELIDDQSCFACGKDNENGLKLSFSTAQGKTVSEFSLHKRFQGYKSVVHGGIIATILDEAMIHAAMAEGLFPVTAEITVRYKQPLFVERPLVVEAELTGKGSRIVETRAHISDKTSGAICAEATAKLVPLKQYP
jgi:uncharacterized protein (TIGR00369 family)